MRSLFVITVWLLLNKNATMNIATNKMHNSIFIIAIFLYCKSIIQATQIPKQRWYMVLYLVTHILPFYDWTGLHVGMNLCQPFQIRLAFRTYVRIHFYEALWHTISYNVAASQWKPSGTDVIILVLWSSNYILPLTDQVNPPWSTETTTRKETLQKQQDVGKGQLFLYQYYNVGLNLFVIYSSALKFLTQPGC